MTKNQQDLIQLFNVKTNNLKSINASFPKGQITVVTGHSGSGKTSLVFSSLFAESQRRYLESLSSFSRQYIKAQAKPEIEKVSNLLPAVAIKQARSLGNNRSTVGTLTEVNSLIELIFFHLGEVKCPKCHKFVLPKTVETATQEILSQYKKNKIILLLAPLSSYKMVDSTPLQNELRQMGYSRFWSQKTGLIRIESLNTKCLSDYFIVIDRISQKDIERDRILEGSKQAFQVGQGDFFICDENKKLQFFSKRRTCFDCKVEFPEPHLSLFSYNSPLGACKECHGYGQSSHIDWDKVIPDSNSNLHSQGIAALSFGSHKSYYDMILKQARKIKLSPKKSFKSYSQKEKKWLFEGDGKDFGGLRFYFNWLESKKYKPHYRMHLARYRVYKLCKTCDGNRYNKDALNYQVQNKSIAQMLHVNHDDLYTWLGKVKQKYTKENFSLNKTKGEELSSAFEELENRLKYLKQIGLGYLNSNRLSSTLSGGELQRIKMARCLGNHLTQTLFCLDEPSSGLHPKDSEKLISIMKKLKKRGNTLVVVEHEKKIIENADNLIEIGPHSGHKGGQIIYEGLPLKKPKKLTHLFRSSTKNLKDFSSYLEIKNASTHNLKNIQTHFPLGCLVGICGVSGSGKTSLIKHTLYPLLCKKLYKKKYDTTLNKASLNFKGSKPNLKDVFFVSQEPISRSSRSTIVTYLGIFDEIRKTYAKQAKNQGANLTAKDFSFNSPGGRCEECKGKGIITEELSFLGSVDVTCHECRGQRFTAEVLNICYKGYSILELLSCSIKQLEALFPESKKIQKVVKQVSAVGLDYMTLGQDLGSFSGGEAQRLKLLTISLATKEQQKACLIFDEPTSGLSDEDISSLLKHFNSLTQEGHSLIIIEHHTGLLKSCDWLIELGPEASKLGGEIIYQGPQNKIKDHKNSKTAPYL